MQVMRRFIHHDAFAIIDESLLDSSRQFEYDIFILSLLLLVHSTAPLGPQE